MQLKFARPVAPKPAALKPAALKPAPKVPPRSTPAVAPRSQGLSARVAAALSTRGAQVPAPPSSFSAPPDAGNAATAITEAARRWARKLPHLEHPDQTVISGPGRRTEDDVHGDGHFPDLVPK